MLSDEQLDILSEAIQPLFQYLEKEVIADIARRIQKTLTYSRTAENQAVAMRNLGFSPARIRKEAMKLLNADAAYRKAVARNTLEYKKEIKKIIENIVKEACIANADIVANAGNMAWVDDLAVWKDAGKKLGSNSFLSQLAESFSTQTAGALKNMAQTTGFKTMSGYEGVADAYRRELDKAVIKICSGTFSQDKVIKDVVHNLAQNGLRTIDFESGYSMQLDTAAALAVRTGCHQLAGRVQDKDIEQTGENLVYVSKHWGARNTGTGHANHEQWQGKVYYIKPGENYKEEAERIGQDYIMDLWYATGYSSDGSHANDPLGLYGYNCRHNHYVWFIGASTFPEDQPEPEPVTINGKTYDYYAMTQKMRYMERGVRALKREKEALEALGMDTTEIKAKIRRRTAEYKEFCKACRVPEKTSHLRYECGTSDLKKTGAWKKYHDASFENELRNKTLGASGAVGDGSQPVPIGQIDISKKEEAVKYFGNEIRNSEIEKLYVIDKGGNVYYNEGGRDAISIGTLDLTDCIVLHNHPKTNGIVSFGADDFISIRDTDASDWYLVNELFDYHLKKIKSMKGITYNLAWKWYMEDLIEPDIEEEQHLIMKSLAKRGYIQYERKKVDSGPAGQN